MNSDNRHATFQDLPRILAYAIVDDFTCPQWKELMEPGKLGSMPPEVQFPVQVSPSLLAFTLDQLALSLAIHRVPEVSQFASFVSSLSLCKMAPVKVNNKLQGWLIRLINLSNT